MVSQIYISGPCAPWTTTMEKFCTESDYFTISNGAFNFKFLVRVLSGILGVPNLH